MDPVLEEVQRLFSSGDQPDLEVPARQLWPRPGTMEMGDPANTEQAPPTSGLTGPSPQQGLNQVNNPHIIHDYGGNAEISPCEERVDLGTAHAQCCAARAASKQVEIVSLAPDTLGAFVMASPIPFGVMNSKGDKDVLKTFHGARVSVGNKTVNQSVSISFDPRTLTCLACEREHAILMGKPSVIIVTDQNYVPTWPGSEPDKCVAVVRMANPTLSELVDFLFEIFDRKIPHEGSVILLGSTSHLQGVGVSLYAREWTRAVGRICNRWPNVRVGPVAPVLRGEGPGGVSRELCIFAIWLAKVYGSSIQGMKEPWNVVVCKTLGRVVGQTVLGSPEYFTIPLPVSLDPYGPDQPTTFVTSTSRPSTLLGLDQGSVGEVLAATSATLNRDFNIPVGTRIRPASALSGAEVQENTKRLVLVGASILKRTRDRLSEDGYSVTDICEPGWTITPENVKRLASRIENMTPGSNTTFVLDLFGNSCYRATLFDGSTTLPIKGGGGGGFHLPGDVGVCGEVIFGKLIDTVMPIIDIVKDSMCILIPPQPRYLYHPCCQDAAHCTNMGREGYASSLLAETVKLRSVLKKKLGGKHTGVHWVMDTCSGVHDPDNMQLAEKLLALRVAGASDGVHLSQAGYDNLAKNIRATVIKLQNGMLGKPTNLSVAAGSPSVSGLGHSFFWRGFSSPSGSRASPHLPAWARSNKKWTYRAAGPYQTSRK